MDDGPPLPSSSISLLANCLTITAMSCTITTLAITRESGEEISLWWILRPHIKINNNFYRMMARRSNVILIPPRLTSSHLISIDWGGGGRGRDVSKGALANRQNLNESEWMQQHPLLCLTKCSDYYNFCTAFITYATTFTTRINVRLLGFLISSSNIIIILYRSGVVV